MTPSTSTQPLRRTALVAKSVAFCAILVALLAYAGAVLKPARTANQAGAAWTSFLAQPKNSLDVIFFGSSHVFDGVDPSVLWRQEGIAAFDHAGPSQELPVTVYYVREALRTQRPKVIALEMSTFGRGRDRYNRQMHQINVGTMPWTSNRVGAIVNATPGGERLAVTLDLWIYHSRWNELTWADFDLRDKGRGSEFLKGYLPQFKSREVTSTPLVLTEEIRKRTDDGMKQNVAALREIAEVCRENDVQLLLFLTPTGPPNGYTYQLETAREALRDYDVRTLDLSERGVVPGLSYEEDFFDGGHLTYKGAEKATAVLADYLAETYALADRRGDPGYASWDRAAAQRDKYVFGRIPKRLRPAGYR